LDRERFIAAVTQEQEPLRRFLLGLCRGNAAEADDLAQEAMLKAYLAGTSFRGQSKFSTWLFRIAYNCFCDRMKKILRRETVSLETPDARNVRAGGASDDGFRHQELYAALDLLQPPEKSAVLLFYMEDRPIKEISDILSCPEGTVKSHLSRARAKLKNILAP
jgi:RNA polymerase sigma factor (sigma-70 family)